MSKFTFEQADYQSVRDLFTMIRESDAREVLASAGQTPEEAITLSLGLSTDAWVLCQDGEPICVFGVAPYLDKPGVGSPWMLASHKFNASKAPPRQRREITRVILQFSKQFIQRMLEKYYLLQNYVDVRNDASIRWLKWCGFTLEAPIPFGYAGLDFHPFYMERPDV